MRQTKYLFIGGPFDQKWERAYGHDATYRVILRSLSAPDEIHMYSRQTVLVPGWVVPLTVYRLDLFKIPAGTVLPGCVEGARPDASPVGDPESWAEYTEPVVGGIGRLREAVKRENDRRLQR